MEAVGPLGHGPQLVVHPLGATVGHLGADVGHNAFQMVATALVTAPAALETRTE